MSALWNRLSQCRALVADRRGNVAVIWALSLVPLMIAIGGGLDLARAMVVRTEMTEALDAAALAVGSTANLTTAQMQTVAQQYFNANYTEDSSYGTPAAVTINPGTQSIQLSTSCAMPTSLLRIAGIHTLSVSASSTVVWGQLKLWVSLVLDNTGSMTQTDSSGLSKISALQNASHQLLNMLQGASTTPGDVQVAIVPFARNVRIGTSYSTSNWLSFSDFTAAPPTPSSSVGPGSTCPWSSWIDGYTCTTRPTNGSSTTSKVPSSGTYKGYICPSADAHGHYWNGCFNSVKQSNGSYTHTWIANATSTWSGCVTDRGTATGPIASPDPYADDDTTNTTPTPTAPNSMEVAENSPSCPVATMMSLNYNWTNLNNEIDAMQANGSTNQTIGLVWGWKALSQGAPLVPPALPSNTQRFIILLSDGLNTQSRWWGDGSNQSTQVDSRMQKACNNAKADGIVIYAVFVDLNGTQGNSSVLQNCATDNSKYFDLTSSSQIVTAFTTIGQQITNLRVAQ